MIGQFTFLDAQQRPHTAALTFRFKWASANADLKRVLDAEFPATDDDRGPSAGNPGEALLRRAADRFGGNVVILRRPEVLPPGAVN